ncbi:hypothetical protein GYMLUDRAFT_981689, partial [Collybiopsis luxurians FD-317 M1]
HLSSKKEVDLYLREPFIDCEPLLYWKENQSRFPRIFKLAMDILPIQGTSVPCERVFSSALETLTVRRSFFTRQEICCPFAACSKGLAESFFWTPLA